MPSDTEDCEVEEILDERMKNDKVKRELSHIYIRIQK